MERGRNVVVLGREGGAVDVVGKEVEVVMGKEWEREELVEARG